MKCAAVGGIPARYPKDLRNIIILSCLLLSAVLGTAAILSHRWALQSKRLAKAPVGWPKQMERCLPFSSLRNRRSREYYWTVD